MKLNVAAYASALFASVLVAPSIALACPGSASCAACTSFGSYVSSMSLGVLIGVASVGIENVLKRRR